MKNLNSEKKKKQYEEYVNRVTPKHSLLVNMMRAFLVGGAICLLGQVIQNLCMDQYGLNEKDAGTWTSLLLIFFSVAATGFHFYGKLAKFGGAGTLVPITGFANSVAAPAIEYQKEGQVFGIGCKIFTIAGPVILYGIFVSWLLGVLYWLGKITGGMWG